MWEAFLWLDPPFNNPICSKVPRVVLPIHPAKVEGCFGDGQLCTVFQCAYPLIQLQWVASVSKIQKTILPKHLINMGFPFDKGL